MLAEETQIPDRQESSMTSCQPACPVPFTDTQIILFRFSHAETDGLPTRQPHAPCQLIIGIDHHDSTTAVYFLFGGDVCLETCITIHVILAEVEHHRCGCIQTDYGFQLETGKLQDKNLDLRISYEIQHGNTDVSRHSNLPSGAYQHSAHQTGDSALAVGPGHCDYRSLVDLTEKLHISNNTDTSRQRLPDLRLVQGHSWTYNKLLCPAQQIHVKAATEE